MRKWLGGIIIALSIAGALFLLFYPGNIVLKLTATKSGKVVFCAPVKDGEEFLLSFIHSVNKRPVYETLRVAGDHLRIVKSRYDAFGAGMPETSTPEGTLKVGSDSWLEWTVNREVPEVILFVGWVAKHSLHFREREMLLANMVEPGTSLTIRAQRVSCLELWGSRCLQ